MRLILIEQIKIDIIEMSYIILITLLITGGILSQIIYSNWSNGLRNFTKRESFLIIVQKGDVF